jgi:hypothetical protein
MLPSKGGTHAVEEVPPEQVVSKDGRHQKQAKRITRRYLLIISTSPKKSKQAKRAGSHREGNILVVDHDVQEVLVQQANEDHDGQQDEVVKAHES